MENKKMELRIDPEFESKIPPLTEDEVLRLHSSILSEGRLISPIVAWNGIIVDGHNRYKFIQQHPEIEYDVYEMDFDNRSQAIAWICRNQLGRRNLAPEQKKYLMGKQYEAEKQAWGGDRKSEESKYQNDTLIEDTGTRLAKENNVSRISVLRAYGYANAVDLAEEAVPGIKDEILSGALKATDTQIMNIGKAAPEQRPALVEQLRQPKPPKKPKPPKEKPTFNPKHYENPASKPKDPELVLIQKIADDMREPRSNGKPGTMIYEMTDAMESMIFRWNFCKSNYAAFFELEECWTEIRKLIRNGYDFLIQYDRGLPHSTDVREFTEVPPTALPHQGRRKVLPDRHLLTTAEIASETPAAISKETPHDILYELDAALDSFTFRWSVCLSHNRDHFDTEEHRTQIFQRAKNGIEYLNQILQGEIPLE